MVKSLKQSENQPFPEVGILYDYDFGRKKTEEVEDEDSFAEADRSMGNFFVFREAGSDFERAIDEKMWGFSYRRLRPDYKTFKDEKTASLTARIDALWEGRGEGWFEEHIRLSHERESYIEQRINEELQKKVDKRKSKPAKISRDEAILRIVNETNGIRAFENHMGHKGHPFESLVVLHYIEQELSEMKNPHYQLAPLEKKWGTNFACIYHWADGDDIDELYAPNTMGELGMVVMGAYSRVGLRCTSYLALDNPEELSEPYGRARKLERELSQAFDEDRAPNLDEDMKVWARNYMREEGIKEERDEDLISAVQADVRALGVARGLAALGQDASKLKMTNYKRSGLCDGHIEYDFAGRNIILQEFDFDAGVPIFTLIDMYYLGEEEGEHQRRTHTGYAPIMGLHVGPK